MSSFGNLPEDIRTSITQYSLPEDVAGIRELSIPIQRLIDEIQTLDPSFDIERLLLQERDDRLLKNKLYDSPWYPIYDLLSVYSFNADIDVYESASFIEPISAIKIDMDDTVDIEDLANRLTPLLPKGLVIAYSSNDYNTKSTMLILNEHVLFTDKLDIIVDQPSWNQLSPEEAKNINNNLELFYNYLTDAMTHL